MRRKTPGIVILGLLTSLLSFPRGAPEQGRMRPTPRRTTPGPRRRALTCSLLSFTAPVAITTNVGTAVVR
jgi:hypothetical protein